MTKHRPFDHISARVLDISITKLTQFDINFRILKRKEYKSDSVVWQKPLISNTIVTVHTQLNTCTKTPQNCRLYNNYRPTKDVQFERQNYWKYFNFVIYMHTVANVFCLSIREMFWVYSRLCLTNLYFGLEESFWSTKSPTCTKRYFACNTALLKDKYTQQKF